MILDKEVWEDDHDHIMWYCGEIGEIGEWKIR